MKSGLIPRGLSVGLLRCSSAVISIGLVTICLCPSASGQGFMVKPMKMEFAPRAGQTVEKILELRNTGADEARTLDLRLVELTQTKEGSWQIIEPGSEIDASKLAIIQESSCLKWVKLSAESVNIEPLEMAPVTVTVRVPPRARGFYCAGLIARTRPPRGARGIAIVIQFLVPLVVEIQGRPVRQKIELADLGMEFREKSEQKPATTLVSMDIANQGRTYSRLKAGVKVMRFWEDHWRSVTAAPIKEVGILPGVNLNLETDIERCLPSGKYKLIGTLYVDGRRIRPLEKEIEFVGDPTVTRVAVDTALVLEPPELSISGAPGSTRTSVIKVENASDDAVNIEAASGVPPVLRGVAFGDLKGEELTCAPWIEVSPAKFTLRAGGRQNIRVIAQMPEADTMHANYYGLLTLRATYPGGQGAGETTTLVCVENKKVEAEPAAQGMALTLAAEEPSKYIVQAKFANTGNVHFTPKCRASLLTGIGAAVAETVLSGEEGLMLPLETRDFSGVLDFTNVEAGTYLLKAVLDYAEGQAAVKQIPIRISLEEDNKVVTIVQAQEETPESEKPPAEAD
ncbi:MAG: hypothetical protein WBC53_03800 [Phycisphaerae bacterium]